MGKFNFVCVQEKLPCYHEFQFCSITLIKNTILSWPDLFYEFSLVVTSSFLLKDFKLSLPRMSEAFDMRHGFISQIVKPM